MKQLFASLALLLAAGYAQSQTTYYFVGGTATSSFTANSNWNTAQNGSGTVRTAALPDDVLIVDGANIGGATATTGTVTVTLSSNTIGQLRLQNNANMVMGRPAGGGGTGTLTINGGTGADLIVSAGSTLSLNGPSTDGAVIVNLLTDATGLINGTINLSNTGSHRITSQTLNGLVFGNGAVANVTTQPASAGYPFGSSSQGVDQGIVFQSGATLNYGGKYSPFGGSQLHQAIMLLPGSNFNLTASNAAATGSWTNLKSFGNMLIAAGVTLTADGAVYRIGNLEIAATGSFITHNSGQTPVLGNLTVNGSLTAPGGTGTNVLVLGGDGNVLVSGSGTIAPAGLAIGNNSVVTLNRNISASNSVSVVGRLNLGTNLLTGAASFGTRVNGTASSVTGSTTAGSFQITAVNGTLSGLNGMIVAGPNLQPNTVVVGFGTAGGVYLNKPATATGTGLTFEFRSDTATLSTANTNGFDSTTGSIQLTGLKTYQAGTNYVINAATTWPVGVTSGNTAGQAVGSLTLNADATTNTSVAVGNVLTMSAGKLSVRNTDTLRLNGLKALLGAPFSTTKYIATLTTGNQTGVVRMDTVTTARLVPVGNANNYLPVTVGGASAQSVAISVLNTLTQNGTASGSLFTPAELSNTVNASWVVNRIDGTGNTDLTFGWPSSLEGSNFLTFSNAQIGISRYTGSAWTPAIGTGDNTANTASGSFTDFGSFGVGRNGQALPVRLTSFTQQQRNGLTEIAWTTEAELNMAAYTLELSANGRDFSYLHRAEARNSSGTQRYQYAASLAPGTYLARLMMEEKDGRRSYSALLPIEVTKSITVKAYPNPVKDQLMVEGLQANDLLLLVDLQGKQLIQQRASSTIERVPMTRFPAGHYRLQVLRNGTMVATEAIVH